MRPEIAMAIEPNFVAAALSSQPDGTRSPEDAWAVTEMPAADAAIWQESVLDVPYGNETTWLHPPPEDVAIVTRQLLAGSCYSWGGSFDENAIIGDAIGSSWGQVCNPEIFVTIMGVIGAQDTLKSPLTASQIL